MAYGVVMFVNNLLCFQELKINRNQIQPNAVVKLSFVDYPFSMSQNDQFDIDPETDEEFLDPKAEPDEDNPPEMAILGFRPTDYNRDSFHAGVRVR